MDGDQNNDYERNRQLSLQAETLEAINKLAENRVALENDAYETIIDTNNLIESQLKVLREQNKDGQQRVNEQRELNKLNRDLLGISRSISSITASELGSEKLQKQLAKDRAKTSTQILQLKKLQVEYLKGQTELERDIAESIGYQIDNAKKLNEELDKTLKTSKSINEDGFLKTFSTLKHIVDLIPGLNKLLPGFNQAAESYREALVLQETSGAGGIKGKKGTKIKDLGIDQAASLNDKIKAFRAGDAEGTKGMNKDFIKSLPKELQATLKGATGTSALAVLSGKFKNGVATAISPLRAAFIALQSFLKQFILIQFVNAILKADKVVGDLAKSFNVTYKEALKIQDTLNSIANRSNSVYVTSAKLATSQMFINKLYGTTAMATNEQLETFTKLREAAGFTNEELQGIFSISLATGKRMENITGEVIAQAKYTSSKYGVSLNEREIVKEIAKVSAATTLSLGKNPGAIAKAVATAKALGMELSKVEQVASSLLNFESSIEDELSAELLLGKELNLEAARYYALTNDIAGVAAEVASQIGTAADFTEMNYLQQNALAKAVGMNREELAQTLYVQEQLVGLTGEEAARKERILNARIAEVGLAQAMNEMANDGYENLEQQASVQDRILAVTEKLSEVFVAMAPLILSVADAILPLVELVGTLFGYVVEIGKSFGGLTGILLGLIPILLNGAKIMRVFAILGFKGAIASIFRSFSAIPYGLGIPLAIAAVAGLSTLAATASSKVGKADDMMEGPTAGAGYGDRILVNTNTGQQTALSNADTISATKAGGASQSTSAPVVRLYLDNEEIANSQMKGMSRI